jgi:lysozyme
MEINEEGLRLIIQYEGFSAKPYKLPGEQYYTCCYGHYGPDVIPDKLYTETEGRELLKHDIERAERAVKLYDKAYHWNINQFSALCSFAYNIGNIGSLTLYGYRSIEEISDAILLYNRDSRGKKLPGLVARRKAEQKLFNTPVDDQLEGSIDVIPT